VVVAGLTISAGAGWIAWTNDRNNEHRLLQVQTRQAGDVVASAILAIESPLATALQVASDGGVRTQRFARFMGPLTGPGREFVSASLWMQSSDSVRAIASVGAPAELRLTSNAGRTFASHAFRIATVAVIGLPGSSLQRIGYALAGHSGPALAVYAERAIPDDRQVPVERGSAFADLNYATYLGVQTRPSDLATTDVRPSDLPLGGYTFRDSIPFGDTTLTLVAAARDQLGGTLSAEIPWIFAIGGVLLTLAMAGLVEQLARRRHEAEQNARTLSGLYEQMDGLYAEQRTIAETLQHALLPRSNPTIPNLEVETRYVAGAGGVDIGGDWYSVVLLDSRRFAFVVGDVSGRGISAATIMARLRFTVRAYLLEGHPPHVVLAMCSRQLDIETDGHFATVLVGIGDVDSRQITLANAGHLAPLIVLGTTAAFAECATGLPLGMSAETYTSSTFFMRPGSMLVAFTDGLIERRGEGIDVGLRRLADAATQPSPNLDVLLTRLTSDLLEQNALDDIAVLAFRWTDGP
jgi:serine phosphatase RsbU (regulator of sigma subunit)